MFLSVGDGYRYAPPIHASEVGWVERSDTHQLFKMHLHPPHAFPDSACAADLLKTAIHPRKTQKAQNKSTRCISLVPRPSGFGCWIVAIQIGWFFRFFMDKCFFWIYEADNNLSKNLPDYIDEHVWLTW